MSSVTALPSHVGFIGLGAMGKPMAKNLARKLPESCSLSVFDIVSAAVDELCEEFPTRVVRASSIQEVAARADIIITMLPEGQHVRSVFIGSAGIICTDLSGKLLLDCSTIDPATSLEIKESICQKFPTASFYDAPVSGGVSGSEDATLAFYLGCSKDDRNLPTITSLLHCMGRNILTLGAPSLGLVAKLSNNYLAAVIGIACIEAYDMAMRNGVDPRVLERVFAKGSGQNAVSERFNPVPGVINDLSVSQHFRPGFRVELMRKDVSLAMAMADSAGCRNVLGQTTLKTYDETIACPQLAGMDSKIIYRHLKGLEDWKKNFD